MINIYSRENCERCEEIKGFCKDNNISYIEKDSINDFRAKAKLIAKGFSVLPVIEIDGIFYSDDLEFIKYKLLEAKNV